MVDCDASGTCFSAVLHQGTGLLAFYSKLFAARHLKVAAYEHELIGRHLKVAAYEREFIGLVQAMRHWRPYLWGRKFVVRTDHYALKYMLDQHLSTVSQQTIWLRF